MAFTQLNPQIPLSTPKGKGQAIAVIDYSEEHHLMWVVIQDATGEIWTWANPEVRGIPNPSMGRLAPAQPPANGGVAHVDGR